MPTSKHRVAVDTNVLIDLAVPRNIVHEAVELLRDRMPGAVLVALPTVMEEVQWLALYDNSADVRRYANHAIDHMVKDWEVFPLDCPPVQHGIVDIVAEKLRAKELLPYDERHDAYLLAHAACSCCTMLLTSDDDLLGVDYKKAKAVFDSHDMGCPLIQSPEMLICKFSGRRR